MSRAPATGRSRRASAASALLAGAAVPVVRHAVERAGLVSRPGGLNPESSPVPLSGGIALLAGALPMLGTDRRAVLLALGPALAVGMADDLHEVPALDRALAWAAIGAGIGIARTGTSVPGVAATAATAVVVTTGVNFLDGIDSLAGSAALATAAGLGMLAAPDPIVASTLAGALLGFLWWNRPPARCYLGNGGSSLLGIWMVGAAADALGADSEANAVLPVACCLALPAAEVLATAVRRVRAGATLAARERGHGYDKLVGTGRSVRAVSASYAATQLFTSACGVIAARTPRLRTPAALLALGAVAALSFKSRALAPR